MIWYNKHASYSFLHCGWKIVFDVRMWDQIGNTIIYIKDWRVLFFFRRLYKLEFHQLLSDSSKLWSDMFWMAEFCCCSVLGWSSNNSGSGCSCSDRFQQDRERSSSCLNKAAASGSSLLIRFSGTAGEPDGSRKGNKKRWFWCWFWMSGLCDSGEELES